MSGILADPVVPARRPFQVSWTPAFVGLLAYIFVIMTYRLPIGTVVMAGAFVSLLLQRQALEAVVDRFARKLPAVARVSIVDATGAILVDSHHAAAPPIDRQTLRPLLGEAGEQRSSFEVAGDRYLRVSRSLRGRYDPVRRSDVVGAVTLDMRLALTDAAVTRDLVSEMALVLALCIPIGGLLYLRTRRSLVRPLEQLAAAGAQFTRGEVPAPLTFSGRDELAGVARTFNEMVEARTAAMKQRERQLADAEAEVKVLRGILPICAQCKRIHTEEGSWQQIESYVRDHSHAEFSHGLCPDCAKATWG